MSDLREDIKSFDGLTDDEIETVISLCMDEAIEAVKSKNLYKADLCITAEAVKAIEDLK